MIEVRFRDMIEDVAIDFGELRAEKMPAASVEHVAVYDLRFAQTAGFVPGFQNYGAINASLLEKTCR